MKKATIKKIEAREILASGSYPTIETKVTLKSGAVGVASVPYGASAGSHEASVLVDKDKKRYNGKGCLKAVRNVEKRIFPKLRNKKFTTQKVLDKALLEMDPTQQKTKLGGNSILSVSLAFARAMANESGKPLYSYIKKNIRKSSKNAAKKKKRSLPVQSYKLPHPMMVVIEGGKHADNSTDFQEYLICPLRNIRYHDSVRVGEEVYHHLKKVLIKHKYNTNVGTEGAFAPAGIKSNEEPLRVIVEAIKRAGYRPGIDVGIGIDVAASELYSGKAGAPYTLSCEKKKISAKQLVDYYAKLIKKYPIISIEDGLDENDWENWPYLYKKIGKDILIVGDDLTVTQKDFLQKAIDLKVMDTILIKPNQVGTLTETLETMALAKKHGMHTIVSHRGGGDTNDTFIMDLAYAAGSLFTKVGPSRGERVEKYNRMMQIEKEIV